MGKKEKHSGNNNSNWGTGCHFEWPRPVAKNTEKNSKTTSLYICSCDKEEQMLPFIESQLYAEHSQTVISLSPHSGPKKQSFSLAHVLEVINLSLRDTN